MFVIILYLIQLLKDFYLLGRGEIFRFLIEKSKDLLKTPPNANTSHSEKFIVLFINYYLSMSMIYPPTSLFVVVLSIGNFQAFSFYSI